MGHFGSEKAAPSYIINGFTSNFDFWDGDMHESKEQLMLMDFLKKFFFWANGPFPAQKSHVFITLDPCYGFFKKFCTVNGVKKYINIILIVFLKKIFIRANRPFWAQQWHTLITLDLL